MHVLGHGGTTSPLSLLTGFVLQDAEALTSAQGLLACVFRHRAQLLMASESSNCTAAMLFLMKFAVKPQIQTPQEAQAALNAASLILAAFREPSTDSAPLTIPCA